MSVAYGASLRVSEVAALKVNDIDGQLMAMRVEQCKDRDSMHSPVLWSGCGPGGDWKWASSAPACGTAVVNEDRTASSSRHNARSENGNSRGSECVGTSPSVGSDIHCGRYGLVLSGCRTIKKLSVPCLDRPSTSTS